eukprot:gene12295-13563_t
MAKACRSVVILLLLNGICFQLTLADMYAAVTELEDLYRVEQRLLNVTKEYITEERRKLAGLKQFAKAAEIASELSKGDPLEYIGNPINSYLLLKRFTWGWNELSDLLHFSDDKLKDIATIFKVNQNVLPTYNVDFVGAAAGLFRLQDTYGIPAEDIADGRMLPGVKKAAHKLTAADCFELGFLAYKYEKYTRMLEWMKEAERLRYLDVVGGEDRVGNLTDYSLFEHLSWAYFISGDTENALTYARLALKHNSSDEVMQNNIKYYQSVIKYEAAGGHIQSTHRFDFNVEMLNNQQFYNGTYARACRGDFLDNVTQPKNISNLRCFYKTNQPKFILKPLKVEQVHDTPEVYIFREILTHDEVHIIQEISRPLLHMSRAFHSETGVLMEASYRISKSAWLFKDDVPTEYVKPFDKFNQICQDVTDLTIETGEELQVVNYGIGGQYEFHRDHGEVGAPLDLHEWGNRIATLLFYLSDVEAGGETVFTKSGVSLQPRKGDAAFWYNLHRNGTGNWLTEHASCPVISGSKWVMNKWFHSRGNEYIRPCSLNKNE